MIETPIPEVNVDELMERIREDVRRRKALDSRSSSPGSQRSRKVETPGPSKPDPLQIKFLTESSPFVPKVEGYDLTDFLQYHDREFVRKAYSGILCREADPPGFNHYLGKLRQGAMTKAEILGRLRYSKEGRIMSIKVRGLLIPFLAQTSYRIPVLGYFIRLITGLVHLPTIINNLQLLDAHTQTQFAELKDYLNSVTGSVHSKFVEIIQYQSSFEDLWASKADRSAFEDLRASKADRSAFEDLRASKADRLDFEKLAEQTVKLDAISAINTDFTNIRRQLRDHKLSILDQQRRLAILFEETGKRNPHALGAEPGSRPIGEADPLKDLVYCFFEDRFRGTREEIKDRQRIYLPYVKQVGAGTKESPIIDVGCGRGEWLELLKEEGLECYGIDNNGVLVADCHLRGLKVFEGDLVQHLRTRENGSLGAVTGFHVIEHLSFGSLRALLDETLRVLRPGGVAIFETPNPLNILVGACNFYIDPTHRAPMHPEMMRFLAESRGLCRVEILPLHPFDEEFQLAQDGSEIVKRFNDYFYGPQDYAVIGVKP
jgi:SAM-dependent methyltransferase